MGEQLGGGWRPEDTRLRSVKDGDDLAIVFDTLQRKLLPPFLLTDDVLGTPLLDKYIHSRSNIEVKFIFGYS